jgi:aldehyde:ferredoxin oxidoreductase
MKTERSNMAGGYVGKILFVDLSSGQINEEELEEKVCHDFIGGYGIGASILYRRQKAGIDALGPENILGLMTGPLTGTPAVSATRYTAVAKSPLTGGWGDANAGGDFGTSLKHAGYDGVFFTGIADKPVYLFIDNGKAELKDASHLWGKDTYETEEILQDEHGENTVVSCIGQSSEKLSLISGIITKKGAAAARSGLGAVMGSKKLKAVAVKGNRVIPIANREAVVSLRRAHITAMRKPDAHGESPLRRSNKYGTSAMTAEAAHSGDTPVKNWGGVGIIDFPDTSGLSGDAVIANVSKHESCWQCPIACQALLKEGTGEYKYAAGVRRPEYETLATFGTLCLNNNTESIAMVNDICNRYGLDTISAGCTIAFAIECYENSLITKKDTDGIEMTWGNHRSIVAMTEKMAKREGFGNVLADGVKLAAERIGKGADRFAIHIGGQELGMHDPKLPPPPFMKGMPPAARFLMDATPGRHTQGFGPSGFQGHIINASGLCMFAFLGDIEAKKYLTGYMKAVTGWDYSWGELLKAGDRIATMRHIFNLREGINELQWKVHPRIIGKPPLTAGPLAGVTADIEAQVYWNLGALDWDRVTTKPSKEKLRKLGLKDTIKDLYSE